MCSECIEKIRQYVTEDKPYFFNEAKKLLFQYCIPIAENNRRLKIRGSIRFCYCKGHDCIRAVFCFDVFYETDRRLHWQNYWFSD